MNIGRIIDSLVEDYHKRGMVVPETKEDSKTSAFKEGQIGDMLAELMVERFRRFHDSLMVFNGKKYEMIKPEDVRKVVQGFLKKVGCGPAYLSRSAPVVHRMIMDNPFLENFDPKRNVIYMRNCVLVLEKNGKVNVMEHDPRWMSRIYIDIPYEPFVECPAWEDFLLTVIEDMDAIKVLQEFLGCMFIDKEELSIEKALFLFGCGSNGKSVIFNVLKDIFGDNVTNTGLDKVNGRSGEYYLDALIGKLLAYTSDMEARDLGSGVYKQLISKEPVTCRPIRQAPFESDDWPMFMANINKGLITTDSSDGFWRRNIVIGFNRIFADNPDYALGQLKADKSFKSSLKSQYSGIFNWILLGRERILKQRGNFTKSKSIEELTRDMRNSSTGVYAFLNDKMYSPTDTDDKRGELKRILSKDFYREYCDWCADNGYRDTKNINRFRDDIMNAKITYKRCMKVDGIVSSGFIFYKVPPEDVPLERNDASENDLWNSPEASETADFPGEV